MIETGVTAKAGDKFFDMAKVSSDVIELPNIGRIEKFTEEEIIAQSKEKVSRRRNSIHMAVYRESNFPLKFRKYLINNCNPSIVQKLVNFVKIDSVVGRDDLDLVFVGPLQVGKTAALSVLGKIILWNWIKQRVDWKNYTTVSDVEFTGYCWFVSAYELAKDLLSFKSEARVDYATVPVLFIDDVGVEKDSAGIVDLIIRRKHHSLPTFCSMNFENNEAGQNGMIQRYGRVFERWTNNNEIINFEEYNFEKV